MPDDWAKGNFGLLPWLTLRATSNLMHDIRIMIFWYEILILRNIRKMLQTFLFQIESYGSKDFLNTFLTDMRNSNRMAASPAILLQYLSVFEYTTSYVSVSPAALSFQIREQTTICGY